MCRAHHSVESFAQAIRAIGEPIHNRTAEDISMAKLLTLLFEVTGLFDMRTRPELLLLQKTMVVVEGVARSLDPKLDMWTTAEPVVREWIERNLGPVGKLEGAAEGAGEIGRFLGAGAGPADARAARSSTSSTTSPATGWCCRRRRSPRSAPPRRAATAGPRWRLWAIAALLAWIVGCWCAARRPRVRRLWPDRPPTDPWCRPSLASCCRGWCRTSLLLLGAGVVRLPAHGELGLAAGRVLEGEGRKHLQRPFSWPRMARDAAASSENELMKTSRSRGTISR